MRLRETLAVGGIASICAAAPAQAVITNFSVDVETSIDMGLDWLEIQGFFGNPGMHCAGQGFGDGIGLVALALLEKRANANLNALTVGYSGSTVQNQARIDLLMPYVIARASPVMGMYAYRDGADLMALSIYNQTGGPDAVGSLAAINATVDRVAVNQDAQG
ncbi:MAG: hypothetical protein EXR76_17535 [Myxococcales bacterium]|nr:hypothetical protein [Myxococcales bacterium]